MFLSRVFFDVGGSFCAKLFIPACRRISIKQIVKLVMLKTYFINCNFNINILKQKCQ